MGAWQHYQRGYINPRLAAPLALGTLVGSFVGGVASQHIAEENLKWAFGFFMALTGIKQLLGR